jgi:hypothetical protein
VFGNPVFDQIRQRGGVEPTHIQEAVATAMRHEFGGEPSPNLGNRVRGTKS